MDQGVLVKPVTLNRQDLVKLVRKWGNVNTDAYLEETCHAFSIPEIEGFVGYKIQSNYAVVFGDPVCSPADKIALAQAFDEECKKANLEVFYVVVSQDFALWVCKNFDAVAVEFGTNFIFDPDNNPAQQTGPKAVLVRKKVKRALVDGATVKEYLGGDPNIEKQIEQVAATWLNKRQGPQLYISDVTLFKDRYGKRWFYAQKDNKIVGMLVLNELQWQKGWLLNNVMMMPDAPKGLSELLIISTLEILEKEGCCFVLAGPAPLKSLGQIMGAGPVKTGLMRFAFRMARAIFHLDGYATFWDKFQPGCQSSFVVFPRKNFRCSSIKALLQAFNVSKC